jgi:Ca2+-binding RTX toxin-like protein
LYGGGGGDEISGGAGNDLLEGDAGSDLLIGGMGNDTLEGGQGLDLYVYNSGDGNDTIIDNPTDGDGQGAIVYDNQALAGGIHHATDAANTYTSPDGMFSFVKSGADLVVNHTLTIKDWQDAQLGIRLTEDPMLATQFGATTRTDYLKVDHYETILGQLIPFTVPFFDDTGNDTETTADPGRLTLPIGNENNLIFAGSGGDHVVTGGGDDQIYGEDGNDMLSSGAGNDRVSGGTGSDQLYGSAGNDSLTGGVGNDQLYGDALTTADFNPAGAGDDVLDGGAGDDFLAGDGGRDILLGGNGNDTLWGDYGGLQTVYGGNTSALLSQGGDDFLDGSTGDDALTGGVGNDTLIGGAGHDVLIGDYPAVQPGFPLDARSTLGGNDVLDGGDGNDELAGGVGSDTLTGGAGDDVLFGEDAFGVTTVPGDDLLDGGDGNDALAGDAGNDVLFGRAGDDQLYGDDPNFTDHAGGNDFLDGGDGNDILSGQGGDDTLMGGAGDDTLRGDSVDLGFSVPATPNPGNDYLDGEDGNDQLFGDSGDDTLTGGTGDDILYGDDFVSLQHNFLTPQFFFSPAPGNDVLDGGDGNDQLFGRDGDDLLMGGSGNDTLAGGDGNNTLLGGDGADVLTDDAGNNLLNGGDGNDVLTVSGGGNNTLQGGADNDQLTGSGGNDVLDGGSDNDILFGGGGNDTYVFGRGYGQDTLSNGFGGGGTIQMAADTMPGDVTVTRVQDRARNIDDLVLRVNGTTDQLTVSGFFTDTPIQQVAFGNGTVWDVPTLMNFTRQVPDIDPGPNALIGFDDSDDTIRAFGHGNVLMGLGGNDVLDGRDGDDRLYGGTGSDTYVFGRGGGHGQVFDVASPGSDDLNTIQLADLLPTDVTVLSSPEHLVVALNNPDGTAGTVDRLTLAYFNENVAFRAVQMQFADGTVWDAATLHASVHGALTDEEALSLPSIPPSGGSGGGSGSGSGGSGGGEGQTPVLVGGPGDDLLGGGPGDDTLIGGAGNDTYLFGRGSGDDTIIEDDVTTGNVDTIQISADVTMSDVGVTRNGDDLVLNINGTADQLTVQSFFVDSAHQIEQVVFADGTSWDVATIEDHLPQTLTGTAGADTLYGGAGPDTLDGGAGNDTLYGYDGNDTYLFGRGSGQDTLLDFDPTPGNADTIQMSADVAPNDVTVTHVRDLAHGVDDLVLSINGTADRLTVQSFFTDPAYRIEEVAFADGTAWDAATLREKTLSSYQGTAGDDLINLYQSSAVNDSLVDGGAGDDFLQGNAGNDVIRGGEGADILSGFRGDDLLDGGPGDDLLQGDGLYLGTSVSTANPGRDTLIGGAGNDALLWWGRR